MGADRAGDVLEETGLNTRRAGGVSPLILGDGDVLKETGLNTVAYGKVGVAMQHVLNIHEVADHQSEA